MSATFNIFMLIVMVFLFVVSSLFSFQRHQALITKVVRNDVRIIPGEVVEAMGATETPASAREGKE